VVQRVSALGDTQHIAHSREDQQDGAGIAYHGPVGHLDATGQPAVSLVVPVLGVSPPALVWGVVGGGSSGLQSSLLIVHPSSQLVKLTSLSSPPATPLTSLILIRACLVGAYAFVLLDAIFGYPTWPNLSEYDPCCAPLMLLTSAALILLLRLEQQQLLESTHALIADAPQPPTKPTTPLSHQNNR